MPIADWDWNNANYALDPEDYVEGTSSLKQWGYNICLARYTAIQNLTYGVVETYMKIGRGITGGWWKILFRNQAPLGESNHDNCYEAEFNGEPIPMVFRVKRYEGGIVVKEFSSPLTDQPPDYGYAWKLKKVAWWKDPNGLCIQVFYWTGAEWAKDTDVIVDPDDKWKDSTINRVGFWARDAEWKLDDTKIYEAVNPQG